MSEVEIAIVHESSYGRTVKINDLYISMWRDGTIAIDEVKQGNVLTSQQWGSLVEYIDEYLKTSS